MTKTSDASPIWYTRWPGDTGSMVYLRGAHAGGFQASLEFSRASRAFRPTDNSNAPDFLFFENAQGIQSSYKDAFMIVNGLLVVSKKFRDVLVEFDLGSSRLYRVPICRDEQKTPSDLAPHYVLHVSEQKPDTFVPEASTDVRQGYKYGTTEIDPNSRWGPTSSRDQLAVRSSSSNGVDLWADLQLMARLFLTDRLKRAIDAAGVKSRALNFQEAILV